VVTVVRIKGGEVRIGVEAGRHVKILRGEVAAADLQAATGNFKIAE
jgi:sRNA-binding carbon storage regulator CsrA